jgi:ankyrin repeat protein
MSKAPPVRLNLDWYRKAAKKNLRAMQARDPKAKLADAQLAVARQHGFSSWRQLKARIESASAPADADAFIDAVNKREKIAVARLLKSGPALANARDAHGASALHIAVSNDDPSIVRILLDHVADVAARYGRSNHTPLSWAMTVGAFKAADVLLKAGVKPDLFCAAGLNAVDALATFFNRNGNAIIGSSATGSSRYAADGTLLPSPPTDAVELASDALYVASRNGRSEAVEFLLGKQVDLKFRAYMGGTPLHWAYFSGSREVIQMLLTAGADPTARDDVMRATPKAFGICIPASWGHMTFLKRRLHEDPSSVNLLEARGTPLHEAARSGQIGAAKTLLKAGADKTIRDTAGKLPVDLAETGGHHAVAKLLRVSSP